MKLLKFVPLCLIEWQIKFNRFLNAETIKTQKDLNECGHNRKFLEHPVRYHLLILGTCRHTVFYRENAAAFFSRLLRQKIAPEQLRFGTIHDINTEENRLNGNCWVYQNFFIEIGYKTRFGYFDDRCFFFKENLGNFRITLMQNRRKSSIYRKISAKEEIIVYNLAMDTEYRIARSSDSASRTMLMTYSMLLLS